MKHIVIAGAGFAGVRLARKLRKQKNIEVTLINDSEDFRYSPAMYRAATGIKIGTARIPLEWMLIDSSNTNLIIGTINKLNKENKTISIKSGQTIQYDYLVMALGAVTTYFNIYGLDKHSYGVKTFEEIMELKEHIHSVLISKLNNEIQNFVIVGAGPTGIELAGALGIYLKKVSKKHKVKQPKVNIYLVEAGNRILPQMSEKVSTKVHNKLSGLNIQILTNSVVKSESLNNLKTSTGMIKTHNVIWTAGTTNNPFFKDNNDNFSLSEKGKVIVNERLQSSNSIYVCGDNAFTKYSGLAYTAIGHANFLSKELVARINHKNRPVLKERNPVQVVPVGGNWSVLQYKELVLSGKAISVIRRLADIIGYTDVLGPLKAMTIWKNSDRTEDSCSTCRTK